MTTYKSCRFVDGKVRWIIVDETDNIINRNPSKDELKSLTEIPKENYKRNIVPRIIHYNKTNACDICGISFEKAPGHPEREYDEKGNWTGKWDCGKCKQRHDPNSSNNIMKSLSDRRTGNLNPNSNAAKGDNFEELTCRWRSTVSTIPVENLNKKLDNYRTPIDHSRDSELGIIQTKGCLYNPIYQWWAQNFKREHDQTIKGFEFDNLILYCASKDGKIIKRIYIFPLEEILRRTQITIVKNLHYGGWYEYYRITDEETIKKVNEIWKKIIDNRV